MRDRGGVAGQGVTLRIRRVSGGAVMTNQKGLRDGPNPALLRQRRAGAARREQDRVCGKAGPVCLAAMPGGDPVVSADYSES